MTDADSRRSGKEDLMTGMARMFSTVATLISLLVTHMLLNLISLEKKFIRFDYLKKQINLPDNLCIMYLSVVCVDHTLLNTRY